jgi:hypothetical protein
VNTCIAVIVSTDCLLSENNNEIEKTLLLCGIADNEKHLSMLEALNDQGNLKGLIFLIHTTRDGMAQFFRWAGLYEVKVPATYRQVRGCGRKVEERGALETLYGRREAKSERLVFQ